MENLPPTGIHGEGSKERLCSRLGKEIRGNLPFHHWASVVTASRTAPVLLGVCCAALGSPLTWPRVGLSLLR